MIAFLGSLGRREFDLNLDDRVTIFDFHGMGNPAAFKACFGGGPYSPDDPCAIHDIDQDTDVHYGDFKAFASVYEGALADCNGNGILDLIDILNETSPDVDDNGIPDECEPTCMSDLNGDNMVGFTDMLVMFGEWGTCPTPPAPCNSDLDLDGFVGILDLFALFGAWGPCN